MSLSKDTAARAKALSALAKAMEEDAEECAFLVNGDKVEVLTEHQHKYCRYALNLLKVNSGDSTPDSDFILNLMFQWNETSAEFTPDWVQDELETFRNHFKWVCETTRHMLKRFPSLFSDETEASE